MACIELFPYLKNFILSYDQWGMVYKQFNEELKKAHSKNDFTKSLLKSTPSGIFKFPSENETFECLGISLGHELRCFLLKSQGSNENTKIISETFELPAELQLAEEMDEYYEHIVSCLCEFAEKQNVEKKFLPLGVTFDMPAKPMGDLERIMSYFQRAFTYIGIERDEVDWLLTVALVKNLQLETCKFFVLNHTSAYLMLCIGLVDPRCHIVLTEWGAAFREQIDNLEFLTNEQKRKGNETIVELDWSKFADGGVLDDFLSEFDFEDGKNQVFSKMIAGRHRAEMFQRILYRLIQENIAFPYHPDRLLYLEMLQKPGYFNIDDIELIEEDEEPDFLNTKEFIKKFFGYEYVTIDECFRLRYLSQSLAKRAAQMTAVILSVLLNKNGKIEETVVCLDDRLFRLKERYSIIPDVLFMLVRPLIHFKIVRIEHDAGLAAAITAGMGVKL